MFPEADLKRDDTLYFGDRKDRTEDGLGRHGLRMASQNWIGLDADVYVWTCDWDIY